MLLQYFIEIADVSRQIIYIHRSIFNYRHCFFIAG